MSGKPNDDRRTVRRAETRAEIVAGAWELAKRNGLSGIAMRDLGELVNMRAQSIYTYFGSKFDIYDAMFMQGYQEFAHGLEAHLAELDPKPDPAEFFRQSAHRYFDFCTLNPVRFQLLFQRTIPGFAPSPESWRVALASYEAMARSFRDAGVEGPGAVDMWTALLTGLVDQQLSNDPGGDRWKRLLDAAVDMYLTHYHIPALASTR